MNEIVRYVKAGTLPEELREGFDPEATVRVEVRARESHRAEAEAPPHGPGDCWPRDKEGRIDFRALMDPARPKATAAEVLAGIESYQARLREDPSLIENDPVGRVRAIRDGTDF